MVSEAEVEMAYRLILGREPENREVVVGKARHFQSLDDLRRDMIASPEFAQSLAGRNALTPTDAGTKPLIWPPCRADVDVPGQTLDRMIRRIEGEFVELGSREPHWSVLTEERFKAENIGQNEDDFFASGELAVSGLRVAASRAGVDLGRYRSCFELGCGLGRITLWLAREFRQVIAGDISAVHLRHAENSAKARRINNITFAHLNKIDRYQALPGFDVFFSIIVLQHNPPPLIGFILEKILDRLNPGGIAYFQVPTYIMNYQFDAEQYLASEPVEGEVEVHCLPQEALFRIIDRTGCKVLEIREDGAIGFQAISNRLLLQKRPA